MQNIICFPEVSIGLINKLPNFEEQLPVSDETYSNGQWVKKPLQTTKPKTRPNSRSNNNSIKNSTKSSSSISEDKINNEAKRKQTNDFIMLAQTIVSVICETFSNLDDAPEEDCIISADSDKLKIVIKPNVMKSKSINEEIDNLMKKFRITPFENPITLCDLRYWYRTGRKLEIDNSDLTKDYAHRISFMGYEIEKIYEPFIIFDSANKEILGHVTIKSKYLTFIGICFDFTLLGGVLQLNLLQFSGINTVSLFKHGYRDLPKLEGKFNVIDTSEIEFNLFCFSYRIRPFGECPIQISRKDRNGELFLTGSMNGIKREASAMCSFLPLYYDILKGYIIQGNVKWNISISGNGVSLDNAIQSLGWTISLNEFWFIISAVPTMKIVKDTLIEKSAFYKEFLKAFYF